MLHSLCVSNYILIGSLETSFPEGLIIISGETGAGKSILLGALSLVLGAKADASLVGPQGDTCVVEAEFSVSDPVRELFRREDLPCEEDRILLRRVVNRSGRSRSFVNDEPVALPLLQELAALLVDIHAQHQTLRLADERFRMDALDLFAGALPAREACREAWNRMQELHRSLEEIRAQKAQAQKDQSYHFALWEALDKARLTPGEWEELESEQQQLSHAEELKETLCAAEAILLAEEASPAQQLRESARLLDKAGRFLPGMEALGERLASVRLEVEDIAEDLARANSRLEASPARLEQVEERISLLHGLMQKHGVSTVEELIAERDRLSALVSDASSLEEKEQALEKERAAAEKTYLQRAEALHTLREKACAPFSKALTAHIHALELEQAVFTASLQSIAPGPNGTESVSFLFSSTGKQPAELSHVASGGELSRIMLSLKAVMARFTRMPTLLFDEIDTGVSGSAADKMGNLVCEMGSDMQIFAITHLPQVAAKGHAHYLVSKEGGQTRIHLLDPEERVMELARMLSGSVITPAAIENARTLLAHHG